MDTISPNEATGKPGPAAYVLEVQSREAREFVKQAPGFEEILRSAKKKNLGIAVLVTGAFDEPIVAASHGNDRASLKLLRDQVMKNFPPGQTVWWVVFASRRLQDVFAELHLEGVVPEGTA